MGLRRDLEHFINRVERHLREHTPKDQLTAYENAKLKAEGKPHSGEVGRLLVDCDQLRDRVQREF